MTLQELFDKAADTNGKTKIFHIAVYIFPRWVCSAFMPARGAFAASLLF